MNDGNKNLSKLLFSKYFFYIGSLFESLHLETIPASIQQLWYKMLYYIYTASKVKDRLNNFLEKTVKLSKLDLFLVTFIKKIDKVMTIYSKF